MKTKELLFRLSSAVSVGTMRGATDEILKILKQLPCDVDSDASGNVTAFIKGKSDYTVMLEAHADEIGMVVTEIKDGFLHVAKCGGVDIRVLPGSRVLIYGKKTVTGVVSATPPHLCKNDKEYEEIDKLWIDVGEDTEFVSLGDFVSFDAEPAELFGGQVVGKSFDDRASCAALILAAETILKAGTPPCGVLLVFASGEELGNRGAKTAAFGAAADEGVAVDVSFGLSPMAPAHKCGKLGEGAMLGMSPVLSSAVTKELEAAAKAGDIPFQYEVMGGETSTDADVISIAKSGIPCGLLSVPLKNMHTPAEIVKLSDIESAAAVLAAYVARKENRDV